MYDVSTCTTVPAESSFPGNGGTRLRRSRPSSWRRHSHSQMAAGLTIKSRALRKATPYPSSVCPRYFLCKNPVFTHRPVIHGTPGAYTPLPGFPELCKKKGIKLVTLSRAGYGGSSRNRGRLVADNVADIQALKEHLGLDKCLVGGWSGGGPLSLACAARLPGCVAALCVAGGAPYNAEGLDWLEGQGQDSAYPSTIPISSPYYPQTWTNSTPPSRAKPSSRNSARHREPICSRPTPRA